MSLGQGLGKRVKGTCSEPSAGEESQRSEEVEVKLTPLPVYSVRKPLARGWKGGL